MSTPPLTMGWFLLRQKFFSNPLGLRPPALLGGGRNKSLTFLGVGFSVFRMRRQDAAQLPSICEIFGCDQSHLRGRQPESLRQSRRLFTSILQELIFLGGHQLTGQHYALLFEAGLQSLDINFSEIHAAAYRLGRRSAGCLPKADTMVY
jgi:hypothetical protein